MKTLPTSWTGEMEATIFTGWIYDYRLPYAAVLKGVHPLMLSAIACAKKKNDKIDAARIADLLRCGLLPESYMALAETRARRRAIRHRNLPVRQSTQMKNTLAGLSMQRGVT